MRYSLIDTLRGLSLISMIAYHACWDLVFIKGAAIPFFSEKSGFYWQQSICWTFILLSGFCAGLGKNTLKRGLTIFFAGLLVTIATLLFSYENRVVFGVLTFLGSAQIFFWATEKLWKRIPYGAGAFFSAFCFAALYNINSGYLSLFGRSIRLQEMLYRGIIPTFIGFTDPEFFSTDYFSFFPWFFLFLTGYYVFKVFCENGRLDLLKNGKILGIEWMGRHSLLIYLLHQPVLYFLIFVVF